ncbi:MAG: peptidoglycan-binding protein, partial [Arenibacter algicola]|nr:peptidoglycan-binding protein [Arenibacter algicola]
MPPFFDTRAPLALNSNAYPWDVVKIKSLLQALGHYDAPEWGVSPFPDRALFDAIKTFQKSCGLRADGVLKPQGETQMALAGAVSPDQSRTALRMAAEFVREQGRNGDTVLAHISPEEAQLLHAVTDGGSTNPTTGLPEFFTDRQLEAADKANESAARTRERVREYVGITRERSSQGKRNDAAGRRDAWNEAKSRVSNRTTDAGSDNRTMQQKSSTGTQTSGG